MSSQCKQLFRQAIDDSKTGNLTTAPAIGILRVEEADDPRPSSGYAFIRVSVCFTIFHEVHTPCSSPLHKDMM